MPRRRLAGGQVWRSRRGTSEIAGRRAVAFLAERCEHVAHHIYLQLERNVPPSTRARRRRRDGNRQAGRRRSAFRRSALTEIVRAVAQAVARRELEAGFALGERPL